MTMIATDELTEGHLIDLPPEAGDINAPRFDPDHEWLSTASPIEQKTAAWRWFATRYEELEPSTPHDADGNYFFGRKEPVQVDQVLRDRFARLIPSDVLGTLAADIAAKGGGTWVWFDLDKLSS